MPSRRGSSQCRLAIALVVASFLGAGCSSVPGQVGSYRVSVATGLQPRLSAPDAVAITIGYLNDQHPDPPPIPPHVASVWAVRAADARTYDGCIPAESSDSIVWITKGSGDYLNQSDHAWSTWLRQADGNDPKLSNCKNPGPQGTLVIDDATGAILGVYPESPGYPHPSP
jgi:hypothetical protein